MLNANEVLNTFVKLWERIVTADDALLTSGDGAVAKQLRNIKSRVRIWRGFAPEGAIPTERGADTKLPIPFFVLTRDGSLDKGAMHIKTGDKGTDITIDPSLTAYQSASALIMGALHVAFPPEAKDSKTVFYSETFKLALKTAGFTNAQGESPKPPRDVKPGPALSSWISRTLKDLGIKESDWPRLESYRDAGPGSGLVAYRCSYEKARKKGKGDKPECPTLNLAASWEPILVGKPCLSNYYKPKDAACGGVYLKPEASKRAKDKAKVEAESKPAPESKPESKRQSRKGRTIRTASVETKPETADPNVTEVSAGPNTAESAA